MKTHTIKTDNAELLVVEMPENIERDYSLIYGSNPEETYLSFRKNAEFKPPPKSEKLENGIWRVLGKSDEIRDEDAAKLFYNPIDSTKLTHYANLRNLFSLIESEIYWENPWGVNGGHLDSYKYLWKEAQEKTFDRNRSVIFVKSKNISNENR